MACVKQQVRQNHLIFFSDLKCMNVWVCLCGILLVGEDSFSESGRILANNELGVCSCG